MINGPVPNLRLNPPKPIIQPPNRPISHSIISQRSKKCPNCKVVYRYDTQYYINLYNQHINRCRPSQINYNNYSTNSNNNLPTYNNPIRVNANNQELNNILEAIGLETKKVLPRGKKDGTFEEKVDYLRFDISKKKIDFINGAEKLNINREKVLEDSMEQFEKIDPFKELKIIFIGEESHDAGGLIREWLTILFKTILDQNTGLFERSDTEEIGYVIKPDLSPSQEKLKQYFFIGKVLAKALLENLTVNCCFNKVIYQLILGETIKLDDLIFIDRPLYKSLKQLISMRDECGGENIAFCEIYFTYDLEGKDGMMYQQDLIENGSEVLVTQDNLDLYINKRIEFYTKSQIGGIKEIISGINTIFPVEYLKIFTSDQLGLLINGTPFIDTEDWRMNTQYKNYNDYDNVKEEAMGKHDKQETNFSWQPPADEYYKERIKYLEGEIAKLKEEKAETERNLALMTNLYEQASENIQVSISKHDDAIERKNDEIELAKDAIYLAAMREAALRRGEHV